MVFKVVQTTKTPTALPMIHDDGGENLNRYLLGVLGSPIMTC